MFPRTLRTAVVVGLFAASAGRTAVAEPEAFTVGTRTGIFYPVVSRGEYVAEGMRIGYVTMKKGDTIATVGVVASQPPP